MYVACAEELHAYSAHKLMCTLSEDLTQRALIHVGVWCMGELGDKLLSPCPPPLDDPDARHYPARSAAEVVDLLERAKRSHLANAVFASLSFFLLLLLFLLFLLLLLY